MTTFINIILIKGKQAKRITWARRGCEGHRPIQNFKGAGGLLLLLLLLLPAACCMLPAAATAAAAVLCPSNPSQVGKTLISRLP